jgi:hypothetical protein
MSDIGNFNSQDVDSHFLKPMNISSFEFSSQANWSPPIEKELIEELKSPIKKVENNSTANKTLCLIVGILAILSICMCVQANSIVQSLREAARVSALQLIRINNYETMECEN